MQWIDYATIKQNVGLAGVLRHYRVSLRRSRRDQYRGRCPIHRGEGRDAFHANLSRNIFHFIGEAVVEPVVERIAGSAFYSEFLVEVLGLENIENGRVVRVAKAEFIVQG